MGLTRSQLHQIKESLDLGAFCKKWWKNLSKEIKQYDLSNYQKTQVFLKMMEGLLIECLSINNDDEDLHDIHRVMVQFLLQVEGKWCAK